MIIIFQQKTDLLPALIKDDSFAAYGNSLSMKSYDLYKKCEVKWNCIIGSYSMIIDQIDQIDFQHWQRPLFDFSPIMPDLGEVFVAFTIYDLCFLPQGCSKFDFVWGLFWFGLCSKERMRWVGYRWSALVSWESEATPSATPFFKRAYKISHPPRL